MSEFEQGLANIMGSFIETELDCVEKQNQEIEQLKLENDYYFKKNVELSTLNTSLRSDRDLYKEVIEEVREYIWSNKYEWGDLDEDNESFDINGYEILQILDKGA